MSVADRSATYDLLEGHFDLSSEFKHAAPPYLRQDPPTYKLRPVRYCTSKFSIVPTAHHGFSLSALSSWTPAARERW